MSTELWWQNTGEAVAGEVTLDTAMDKVMARLERAGVQGDCGPKLNDGQDASVCLDQEGSPKAKPSNTTNSSNPGKAWQVAPAG